MLLGPAILISLLGATPEVEGRGSGFDQETHHAARQRVRLGGSLRTLSAFGLAFGNDTFSSASGGLGVAFDVGLLVGDRVAIFAHGEISTLVISLLGSGGLGFEVFVSDRVSLGGAVGLEAQRGVRNFLGFTFPVRATFFLAAPNPTQRLREGLVLGLQVSPCLGLSLASGVSDFAVSTSVSFGYAWW